MNKLYIGLVVLFYDYFILNIKNVVVKKLLLYNMNYNNFYEYFYNCVRLKVIDMVIF